MNAETLLLIIDGSFLPAALSLYCTVLYCTDLYCTVLYCTALTCEVRGEGPARPHLLCDVPLVGWAPDGQSIADQLPHQHMLHTSNTHSFVTICMQQLAKGRYLVIKLMSF